MKRLLIFLLLSIIISCSSDMPKEVIEETYANGTPKLIRYFNDTILVKKVEFYDNGVKRSEYDYKDSVKYTNWDIEGNLLETGTTTIDEKNGRRCRYIDGLKKDENYLSNGLIDSSFLFYPNGMVYMITKVGKYSNHAIMLQYYENGQLKQEFEEFGNRIGYYENGNKKFMNYADINRNDSLRQFWDIEGKLVKEVNYENGLAIDSIIY